MFPGIYFWDFPGILESFREFIFETCREFWKVCGIFWNLPGILESFWEFFRLAGNFEKFPGIFETCQEFWKVSGIFLDLPGILESLGEFLRLSGNFGRYRGNFPPLCNHSHNKCVRIVQMERILESVELLKLMIVRDDTMKFCEAVNR